MKEAVIVSAARTPFGRYGGGLKSLKAPELGGLAIKEAIERAKIAPEIVDEMIYGIVVPAGVGQIPARQAALAAGLPKETPCLTINKVCGSALKAVTLAAQIIKAGDADIIVAGGMESMSNIPYYADGMRWGARMFDTKMTDGMVKDGLWCPQYDVHMAVHGGGVAKEYGISREMQDKWALRSQQNWAAGEEKGVFDEERFPVEIKGRKGKVTIVEKDEAPRPETTMEGLEKLPPLFDPENTVTAGNAPGTNDGASAVVIMSREKAEELGCGECVFHRGNIVTECAHSNISILKDGVLITHPTDHYILPGITRKHIIEICKAHNIPVDETPFTLDDLIAADEVLVSSSTKLCCSADTFDGKSVGGKAPELLKVIQDAYMEKYLTETA